MRSLILAAVIVGSAILHAQQPPQALANWPGIYKVVGQNNDGSSYDGFAEIAAIPDTALYEITWVVGKDHDVIRAVAFEHNGRLVVSGTSMPLLASYDRSGSDTLSGLWIILGVRTPMRETLTRSTIKALPVPDKGRAAPVHVRAGRDQI